MSSERMFICKKYNVSMLASKADETCAKRFEGSLHENSWVHDFAKCRTCKRGAMMYELGRHKMTHPHPRPLPEGEGGKQKGETIMAKEFHKKCDEHGPFSTGSNRGICPQCKAGEKQDPAARGAKKDKGVIVRSSLVPSSVGNPAGGAVSISIDLTRFPKLHSMLINHGINTILEEMETKA